MPLSISTIKTVSDVRLRSVDITENVLIGQVLFESAAGQYALAAAEEAKRDVQGIIGIPGDSGNSAVMLTNGLIDFGSAILTLGKTYYLGTTPGQIVLESELASGDEYVIVGFPKTTSQFIIDFKVLGTVKP